MTHYVPTGFKLWPAQDVPAEYDADEIPRMYEQGYAGVLYCPEAAEKFRDEVLRAPGASATIREAAAANGWEDSHAGKLVVPFLHVEKRWPGSMPGPAQRRGDCFPPGTLVRMADGSEKPIESVRIGELVLSHTGQVRPVLDTIEKPYAGELVKVRVSGFAFDIEATPDHQFVAYLGMKPDWCWKPVGELSGADGVYCGGIACQVESISRRHYEGPVYCLMVGVDHSFVANGFAVHNCVSHSTKNACLLTLTCEVAAGKPDEVTGKVEDLPDVPEQGIRQGVLSTEAIYWWRRHGGDGWYCQDAARVVCKESGTPWPRKAYPEFDLDLTNYSAQLAGKWGSTPPPSTIRDFGMKHAIRTAAECDSFEEIRDALGNGYGVSSCGSEGFSSRRNEDGVSSRSGSWAHAMAYIGADDRDETKRKYGGPLVLVLNSWAVWNNGPRRILGTQTDIPEGSFWARWSDVKRRYAVAFSGVNGWPRKRLPDLLGLNYG